MTKDKDFILRPDEDTRNADWIKKAAKQRKAKEAVKELRKEIYDPALLPEAAKQDLDAYMDHLQERLWSLYKIGIDLNAPTTEARAEKLIDELKRHGLIEDERGK